MQPFVERDIGYLNCLTLSLPYNMEDASDSKHLLHERNEKTLP